MMKSAATMGDEVKTTCPYCGVGCGVIAKRNMDGTVVVRGDPDHPANFGRLCSKGSALHETVGLEGRLLAPEIDGRKTNWDEALDTVASKFSETIAEHGPDSVAFYVSGQILTEDYYVANKLMKGFIGSANIDTNSRLCMSSSVAAHKRAFGSDTVPGTYEDLELADVVVLVGSNLVWCHPVIYQRIAAAKEKRPHMKIVVIDPRKTMTASIADIFLPIRPDGDVALFAGLLQYLAKNDALNKDYIDQYTNGFEDTLKTANEQFSMDDIVTQTGLSPEQINQFYELFRTNEKTVTVFSQGVNQSISGTDKANAIINCHLATGRIGRSGMGPFSITGQPNAMGGREVGGLANMLAAHMDIENPDHRNIVQSFWQSPRIASRSGLKAIDMFKGVADGRIKAIWIMSTNPVVSLPEADSVAQALADCPFVVVSDVVRETDTTAYANVLLPASGWGEKNGTVTNSERTISRQRAFLEAPGEAKPDWWQMCEVAKRMGFENGFSYSDPSEIFAEHAALSAHKNNGKRDFDIGEYASISQTSYDDLKPSQWPRPNRSTSETTRFFAKGKFYTPDGRARFVSAEPIDPRPVDKQYPFTLNTGRIRDQWHTMTRSGKSPRLSQHISEPFAEIHPDDAVELDVATDDLVQISSPHGTVLVRALVTDQINKGNIFVPIHWTDQFASRARIDTLIPSILDPLSGQPASKNAPVSVEKFVALQYGFLLSKRKPKPITADYWALAKTKGGWQAEFASANPIPSLTDFAYDILGVTANTQSLQYTDSVTGSQRMAAFRNDALSCAIYLSRSPLTVSRNWATQQLLTVYKTGIEKQRLLAGRPGTDMPDHGAIICSCFSIGKNQITKAASEGCASVDAIGNRLKAGTNCGSCRIEIQKLLSAKVPEPAE